MTFYDGLLCWNRKTINWCTKTTISPSYVFVEDFTQPPLSTCLLLLNLFVFWKLPRQKGRGFLTNYVDSTKGSSTINTITTLESGRCRARFCPPMALIYRSSYFWEKQATQICIQYGREAISFILQAGPGIWAPWTAANVYIPAHILCSVTFGKQHELQSVCVRCFFIFLQKAATLIPCKLQNGLTTRAESWPGSVSNISFSK